MISTNIIMRCNTRRESAIEKVKAIHWVVGTSGLSHSIPEYDHISEECYE